METETDLRLKEKAILPNDILGLGGAGDPVRMRPELSVGRNFGYIVITIIAVTIVFLGLMLVHSMPAAPALNAPNSVVLIERYKEMNLIATDTVTKIFDLVIIKGLLPVFTLIVGYLLGNHARNRDSPAV